MFQGHTQSQVFKAPFRGMDTTIDNNPEYAKYLQNMLISDNNTCSLRYGTRLIAEFPFDNARIFRSQIAVMSHLGASGTSKKIVYQNYLQVIPYINFEDDVELQEIDANNTRIVISLDNLDAEQKEYIKKRVYDDSFIYIRQASQSEGLYIVDVEVEDNNISFDIGYGLDFFDRDGLDPDPRTNTFELWWERAGLYELEEHNFAQNSLIEDLDPNVIISSINYQGKLLIANGVDHVMVYDGNTIEKLQGNASIITNGEITTNNNTLRFNIPQFFQEEIQRYVNVGSSLKLINRDQEQEIEVTNIAYAAPANNLIAVTLTLVVNAPNGVRTILYKKEIPHFNFITVANDRLWALAEGRSYKNKFRPSNLSMKAYYASDRKSIDGWFNQKTNEIEFIDLSTNSAMPDNLEAILPFQGKVLFLGRETTQVWQGEDPTVIDDGQNIQLPDFKWEMTVPVGIIQKSLFVEIPNDFIFLSKYGIVSLSSINKYQQLSVSYNFSNGINQHLHSQLEFIENDQDYRALKAFLYPYGRFLGFKLKYNCLIHQLKLNGTWSIFSENFADCRSVFYDEVSQDLFLGMDNGVLLAYADKIQTQTYEEYGKGAINWRIHYSWIYPETTWNNEAVFIACRTLDNLNINIQIYTDYNDAINFDEIIEISQQGGLYDNAEFSIANYAYRDGDFPYEVMRFAADSVMVVLHGTATNEFVFDKLFLAGGVARGN